MDCKIPDMLIFEPRGQYKGLMLELKRDDEKVFKADGSPYAGHLYEQWKILQRLTEKGYFAVFACGFNGAKNVIDELYEIVLSFIFTLGARNFLPMFP
jgi:hypothetical protein